MSLAELQTTVADLVRDRDALVSDAQRDAAIAAAVAQYSSDRPRQVVVDQTSDGSYFLDLPAGWTDDSRLIAAEYPIGHVPAALLAIADITFYASPTGVRMQLPLQPAADDDVRITYTAAHLLDDDDDSIPARHAQAVASLAASILCGQLASYYASESEPTISADTVDRKTMSDRWRARQRDLAAVYGNQVGPAPSDRNKAASATVALQHTNALGRSRLFHPVRNWPQS